MKKLKKEILLSILFNGTFLLISALLFTSCSDNEEFASKEYLAVHKSPEATSRERDPAIEEVTGEAYTERHPVVEEVAEVDDFERYTEEAAVEAYPERHSAAEESPKVPTIKKYKVELGADPLIKIPGIPGELRVWIGFPEYEATFREGMSRARGLLPAVGETARVTPFTTGLKVEPKESICMKIYPTGSEIRFKLIPIKEGIFNVGVDIHLFDSDDCSGAPIPKASKTLQVEVKVDKDAVRKDRNKKLWEVFWEKFLDFWGAVVALFFGVVLFLLRNQLKKLIGYESDR